MEKKVVRHGMEIGHRKQLSSDIQERAKSCLEVSALHICGRSQGIVKQYLQTSTTYDGTVWFRMFLRRFGPQVMALLERRLDHKGTNLIRGMLGGGI